jgi:hypothetical protein
MLKGTEMTISRFSPTKRFCVIIDNVSFFATARQIRNGLGAIYKCNAAAQKALDALEFTRSGSGAADRAACGIAGTWEGLNVQLDIV